MSDCCGDDYLIDYRRFFDIFALSVDLTDQLPVKVAGYNLTKFEIPGAVTDWCLQYLNLRQCPTNLIVPLIHLVLEEMIEMIQKQPEACGYRSIEDDYLSLRLMQVTMRKLVEVCAQYKDNAQLSTLPSPKVGLFSPLTSMCAVKNSRRSMEDRHIIIEDFHSLYNIEGHGAASYYGVFDGHNGLDAAVYSVAHLHQYLADSSYYPTDPVNALKDAFRQTDKHFICKSEKEKLQSGTTALCALFRPKENMLYVAWLGDSQAVLIKQGQAIKLVKPHKPERMDEKQRIEEMGGTVLFWGMWRVNGQLAVSRAIGDIKYKPYVSAEPDVESVHLDGKEDFLILASDGLWDYVSELEATNTIYHHLSECPGDVEGVSQRLVALAKEQGSTDNISVVVVFLAELSEVTQRRHMETASPNPFLKQNGADHYCGVPTNGKLRSCTTAAYDDEDDFGPETDVDMVDDVLLSPAIAAAKALVSGKKDYDDDHDRQRQQLSDFDDPADIDRSRDTPTPPAHEVAGNADVDNLTESGDGEDSEEDEWNFIAGSGHEKKEETLQQEEDDDMSSQLNPNAAEFVPTSPKRKTPADLDPVISSSDSCSKQSFENLLMPTQQEFSAGVSKCPGENDFSNQNDHSMENSFNDSSIIVAHQTLEDSNILSTKAEFGDSSHFETSMNASNPFSIGEFSEQKSENVNLFSSPDNSFGINNLVNSAVNVVDAASNLDPVRTIKEFKTFADVVAEPKKSATTPDFDELTSASPRSTIVEVPASTSSDISPSPQQEDNESLDDYLQNAPEGNSPSEEQQELLAGQEPNSSSGFESESGAEEAESNVIADSNSADNDGFVEMKRQSPTLQTLSFKPIETFGDTNPFGLLDPSPIYKPQALEVGVQSVSESSALDHKEEIPAENPVVKENIIDSENVIDESELPSSQVNQDLGLKQDGFAFGGLDSDIKANEFIFGASSSETEGTQPSNENEESKIRLDEQECEQKIETKDAAFGVDLKQASTDAISSAFGDNLIDVGTEQCSLNPFEEMSKQSREYEAKETDFRFDSDKSDSKYFGLDDAENKQSVLKDPLFDISKERSNLNDNEKEADTAIEEFVPHVSSPLENLMVKPVQDVFNVKEELKLDLLGKPPASEDGSAPPSPAKDASPLSPKAQPFVPKRVPVEEPPCKQVILEKKFTEPDSESDIVKDDISCDLAAAIPTNYDITNPEDYLSSQIPKLDLESQISLSEPEIHEVRENINEIIKEAELISNLSSVEEISQPATASAIERFAPEPVSEVLENELIVQSTEPVPLSLHPLSPDHLNTVQENREEISSDNKVSTLLEGFDVTGVPSTAGTPPSTPAPGLVEEPEEMKEGLLAAVAAVAAAGAVTAAAVTAVDKVEAKKTSQAKKTTNVTAKKPDVAAKTSKPTATAKPTAKPTTVKSSVEVKKTSTAPTKPPVKSTVPSKPLNSTTKAPPKPLSATSKPNPTAPKSAVGAVKATTVKLPSPGGAKPATVPSKSAAPVSKPSTASSQNIRPTSANKPDSGKASPTKTAATAKPALIKNSTAKVTEKKPLTNGDVLKPAPIKKAPTSTSTTATKLVSSSRAPSATTKSPIAKPPTSTTSKLLPSAKPAPAAVKQTAKTAPAAKPAVKATTTITKTKSTSAVTTTKTIDKTGKDNVNKQISSEKTGSKTLANKTTTKKTDIKSAGSGKPKPVTKPGSDATKEDSKEKVPPTQEGLITTTNGYSEILENGVKKDDSPLDNSHQDIIEAIN